MIGSAVSFLRPFGNSRHQLWRLLTARTSGAESWLTRVHMTPAEIVGGSGPGRGGAASMAVFLLGLFHCGGSSSSGG
eukprot:6577273-Pyramimonas_sp.AAC.1